jgi:hypothetical protein
VSVSRDLFSYRIYSCILIPPWPYHDWKVFFIDSDLCTPGTFIIPGSIQQLPEDPLAAFASALDPRAKQLKAYSTEDRKKIWAGLHQ